jgi:hypothetical protein
MAPLRSRRFLPIVTPPLTALAFFREIPIAIANVSDLLEVV